MELIVSCTSLNISSIVLMFRSRETSSSSIQETTLDPLTINCRILIDARTGRPNKHSTILQPALLTLTPRTVILNQITWFYFICNSILIGWEGYIFSAYSSLRTITLPDHWAISMQSNRKQIRLLLLNRQRVLWYGSPQRDYISAAQLSHFAVNGNATCWLVLKLAISGQSLWVSFQKPRLKLGSQSNSIYGNLFWGCACRGFVVGRRARLHFLKKMKDVQPCKKLATRDSTLRW